MKPDSSSKDKQRMLPLACKHKGCGQFMKDRESLLVHLISHTKKSFNCAICQINFGTKGNLEIHLKSSKHQANVKSSGQSFLSSSSSEESSSEEMFSEDDQVVLMNPPLSSPPHASSTRDDDLSESPTSTCNSEFTCSSDVTYRPGKPSTPRAQRERKRQLTQSCTVCRKQYKRGSNLQKHVEAIHAPVQGIITSSPQTAVEKGPEKNPTILQTRNSQRDTTISSTNKKISGKKHFIRKIWTKGKERLAKMTFWECRQKKLGVLKRRILLPCKFCTKIFKNKTVYKVHRKRHLVSKSQLAKNPESREVAATVAELGHGNIEVESVERPTRNTNHSSQVTQKKPDQTVQVTENDNNNNILSVNVDSVNEEDSRQKEVTSMEIIESGIHVNSKESCNTEKNSEISVVVIESSKKTRDKVEINRARLSNTLSDLIALCNRLANQ